MGKLGKCIIFSAPSGSGKSTIINQLMIETKDELKLRFSTSATSRPPRGAERDGEDYHFISEEEFRRLISEDAFLEYEEVYEGRYYGTLKSEVENRLKNGENVIFDIDVKGACHIKEYFGERAISIFIKPPSIEALRERLVNRGTETPEEINYRIERAEFEISYADKFDKIIVNAKKELAIKETIETVRQFIKGKEDGKRRNRNIGIFGGSFNPIHQGHVALSKELCQSGIIDELWLLVSPLNPLKQDRQDIIDLKQRMDMAQLALKNEECIKVSDFESTLPTPSYTYSTLHALAAKYPEDDFFLVIGADNWLEFEKWFRSVDIIHQFRVLIYARPGCNIGKEGLPPSVSVVKTQLYDISSTQIRQRVAEGLPITDMVSPEVEQYIKDKGLYKKQS